MKGTWIDITTDYDVTNDILEGKYHYRINDKMFATLMEKSGLIYHTSKRSFGSTIVVNERELVGDNEINKLVLFLSSIISEKTNPIRIITNDTRIRSGSNNTTNVTLIKATEFISYPVIIEILSKDDNKKICIQCKDFKLLPLIRKRTPFYIFYKEHHVSGYTVVKNNKSMIVHDYVQY